MRLLRRSSFLFSSFKMLKVNHNIQEKVSKITLTNVEKKNALSQPFLQQIQKALKEVSQKIKLEKTKIVFFQSQQSNVFCSGHNLKQLASSKNPQLTFAKLSEVVARIKNIQVPTVCLVNGIVAAGGLQLALAFDMIIATQNSTFSTPGIKWGLFCSTPAVQLIRNINSQKKAKEMLFFGEPITAQQAYQYGLINKVVPKEKLTDQVKKYVKAINSLSGQVIKHGKKILSLQKTQSVQNAYKIAEVGMKQNMEFPDCKEGLKAFSDKRQPRFKK